MLTPKHINNNSIPIQSRQGAQASPGHDVLPIDYLDNTPPTAEEETAIEALRLQVLEYSRAANVAFDDLFAGRNPDVLPNFSVQENNGKLRFGANTQVLLGLLARDVDPEGITRHEIGHVANGSLETSSDLRDIGITIMALQVIHKNMQKRPVETQKEILREFDSFERFNQLLEIFEANAIPFMAAIGKKQSGFMKPNLIDAPSAKIARLIEYEHSSIDWLNEHRLRTFKTYEVEAMVHDKTLEIANRLLTTPISESLPERPTRMDQGFFRAGLIVERLLQSSRQTGLYDFAKRFSQGEEYAADGYSARNADDPYSLIGFLRHYRSICDELPSEGKYSLKYDFPSHPPDNLRKARAKSIIETDSPPADAELTPRPSNFAPPRAFSSRIIYTGNYLHPARQRANSTPGSREV